MIRIPMASLRLTQHVHATPEVVFELASDLERVAEHVKGIERVELLTDGPIGVGTRFRETRIMFKKETSEDLEITAFDPPHSYTVECDSCGSHFRSEFRFIPDVSGTTIELLLDTRANTLLAKLMSPLGLLMMGSMRKIIQADLDDIKRAAEERVQSQ